MYCKDYLKLHDTDVCVLFTADHCRSQTVKNLLLRTTIVLGTISSPYAADLNTARIDELTGLTGKFDEKENVYKITLPRNDVKVAVDGWKMPPFVGLGTWAAFTPTKDGAIMMGDTVLFEDEVNA